MRFIRATRTLLVCLCLIAAADIWVTTWFSAHYGFYEFNPAAEFLFSKFGWWGMLVLKVSGILLTASACFILIRRGRAGTALLMAFIGTLVQASAIGSWCHFLVSLTDKELILLFFRHNH